MMRTTNTLHVFQTTDELHKAAAQFIIDIAGKSIAARGRFIISLSGGETPKKLYSLLSEPPISDQIEWGKSFVFWGDERCVPLEDSRNNAHQAKLLLLNKVGIPISNIHRIPVNLSPEEAATNYEDNLKIFFGNDVPRFDLILLGLGENGHTASLFPYTPVLADKSVSVKTVFVKQQNEYRITMTAPMINQARHIVFLVYGQAKANAVQHVIENESNPEKYPAQLINPEKGELCWYLDEAAAADLKKEFRTA